MSDPSSTGDPWEPHWLPDAHPDDKAALSSLFSDIHPDDSFDHDHPIPLVPGVGIPDHMFADAPAPVDPTAAAQQVAGMPGLEMPPPGAPIDPPPMPAPDAISGGQLPPSVGDILNPNDPRSIASVRIEPHAEQYSGDPMANPVEAERDAAAADMALHEPVKFAQLEALHKQTAADHFATQVATAAENDRFVAEANLKNYKDANEKTTIAMQALSKQVDEVMARKIDPSRMMRNRSGFTRMVDLIGALAGGVAQGAPGGGGRNTYVDHLDKLVDQDIDAQKFDIQNAQQSIGTKRGLLAEEYARTGNLYQSTEAVRIAMKASALTQIQAQQQLYDLAGTRFFTLGQAAADMTSRIAAGRQALADKNLKQELEIGDHNIKVAAELRAQRADAQKAAHDAALLALKQAGSGGAAKPKEMVNRALLAAEGVDPALLPADGVQLTREDWDKRMGSSKKSSEASKALGESLGDAVPDVATDDGTPYRAASPEEAAKLRDKRAAVERASDLMDTVLRLRDKYGWSSDLLRSSEWQQSKAAWGQLKLEKKNVEQLGAISGSDMTLMDDALGASDPTSIRDPSPGIRAAKQNMVSGINTDFTAKRRLGSAKPKPWGPADRSHNTEPVKTDADKSLEVALSHPKDIVGIVAAEKGVTVAPAEDAQKVILDQSASPAQRNAAVRSMLSNPKAGEISDEAGGMLPDQQAAIDQLAAHGDVEKLRHVAVEALAPGTRAYALGKMMVAHGERAKGKK